MLSNQGLANGGGGGGGMWLVHGRHMAAILECGHQVTNTRFVLILFSEQGLMCTRNAYLQRVCNTGREHTYNIDTNGTLWSKRGEEERNNGDDSSAVLTGNLGRKILDFAAPNLKQGSAQQHCRFCHLRMYQCHRHCVTRCRGGPSPIACDGMSEQVGTLGLQRAA